MEVLNLLSVNLSDLQFKLHVYVVRKASVQMTLAVSCH